MTGRTNKYYVVRRVCKTGSTSADMPPPQPETPLLPVSSYLRVNRDPRDVTVRRATDDERRVS